MKKLIAICCLLMPYILMAQTKTTNAGWFTWSNNSAITEKISAFNDVQLRTGDDWVFLKQVEVNAGINYNISPNQEIGIGGTYTSTRESYISHLDESDHRIFEQYTVKDNFLGTSSSHRFRLEQRFVETVNNNRFFAQRMRYRFKIQLPFAHQQQKFTHGFYVSAQNEIFLNVQNKEKLNAHLVDQNRAMVAIGYRISKHLDIEGGYLNAFSVGKNANKYTHIFQFSLATKF